MSKITEKVTKKMNTCKEFVKDNAVTCAIYGGCAVVCGGLIIYDRIRMKKYDKLWNSAMDALESNGEKGDYGPYKIMEFFEPKTMESLGRIMCHERATKLFLDMRNERS